MNTMHSVSDISRMRSSEAVAVRKSFSFRSWMMRVMLVMMMVVGGNVAWGQTTGTIYFGNNGTNINSTNVTGDDDLGNTWTITTVMTQTSFTQAADYSQVGSSKKPATSIIFTTTLPSSVNITSMSAKFGGFSGTAGDITLKVGSTTIGSGSLSATSDVTVNSNSSATGSVLTVTVTNISKGVKVYYISYTYETVPGTPYTVTFDDGSGNTSSSQEASVGSGVTLPTATAPGDCSAIYTFYGWTTEKVVSKTSVVPNIIGKSGETYHPTGDITLYAVYKKVIGNDVEKTYNFSEITDFDSWDSQYSEHIVNYDVANVVFASANHQNADQPITDIPVTKGNDVSLVLRDSCNRIKEVSFVCRQWNNRTQTITLHYSTDGGSSYTSTGTTSTNFIISSNSLDSNTNAVKITFNNISYQVGIGSCTIKIAENAIYTSNPDCTEYTIAWYINGSLENSVIYENDFPLADNDVPQNPETPSLCSSKIFLGWSETEFEKTNVCPTLVAREDIVGSIVTENKTYYAVFATEGTGGFVWKLVTSASNMSEGTYIIGALRSTVASNNYYIATSTVSNDWTVTDEYITISSNGELTNLPTGSAEFVFTGNNTNGYTISNGSNYLGFSNVNQTRKLDLAPSYSSTKWMVYDLDNTLNSGGIYLQYFNGNNKYYTITENSTAATAIRGYNSNTKYRAIYLFKKTTAGPIYSAYTTFCPCAFDTDGIEGDNNFIWTGKNVGDDWGLTSNWVVYNSSEPEYHLAANEPTNSTKVYIIQSEDCNIVTPTVAEDATCGNFTINGFNIDIAENKSLTINGTATFTNGIINGNVVFGEDAIVSGASTDSHVDGIVTKSGAANSTDFYFPTGSNGNLGKVVVTDGSATNVSVQYFCNPDGFGTNDLPRWWNAADMSGENPFNHVSNVEYWRISSNEAITANFVAVASAGMQHFNSETAEEDKIPTNIQMAFYDNKRWTNVGGSAFINDSTLTITGAEIPASATRDISGNYTTFGSKSKSTVLPIELTSFTATCNGKSSLIEWTTATEKNNDFFVLERSYDAVNFKEIARVAGAGNSIEPINYAYTDYGARSGDNYYRLVQIDYDGTSTASEIIVANCPAETSGEPDVLAFPNPFDDNLTLHFENFGNVQATVEVYDMLGRMVQTQKVNCSQNDYEVVLRLAGLSEGTYNVRISTKEFVLNKKVVKQ